MQIIVDIPKTNNYKAEQYEAIMNDKCLVSNNGNRELIDDKSIFVYLSIFIYIAILKWQ